MLAKIRAARYFAEKAGASAFSESVKRGLAEKFVETLERTQTGWQASAARYTAEGYVDQLEDLARRTTEAIRSIPNDQKKRVKTLESIARSAERLCAAMHELDDEAAAWLLSNASPLKKPTAAPRAFGLHCLVQKARDYRREKWHENRALFLAAESAAESLPQYDFRGHDPRLKAAETLLHIFRRYEIQAFYLPSSRGLAYRSLREIFGLVELHDSEPAYWIKKVLRASRGSI